MKNELSIANEELIIYYVENKAKDELKRPDPLIKGGSSFWIPPHTLLWVLLSED
jgi:hypothetical protein